MPDPSFSRELLSLTILDNGTVLGFTRNLNIISEVAGLAGPGVGIEFNEAEDRYDLTIAQLNLAGTTPQPVAETGNGGEANTAAKSDHRHAAEPRTVIEIDSADSPYTLASTYCLVLVDTTGGNVTINMPTAVALDANRSVEVALVAGGNDVTLDGFGAQTVGGQAAFQFLAGVSIPISGISLRPAGGNWVAVAGMPA